MSVGRNWAWIVAVDTLPLEDQTGTVSLALRIADVAIVSMASTMVEYEGLPEVWAAINDVEPLRARPLVAAVLMSTLSTREQLTRFLGYGRDPIVTNCSQ